MSGRRREEQRILEDSCALEWTAGGMSDFARLLREVTAVKNERRHAQEEYKQPMDDLIARCCEAMTATLAGVILPVGAGTQYVIPGIPFPAVCRRVWLPSHHSVMRAALKRRGVWDGWEAGRAAVETGRASWDVLSRIISICQSEAENDSDCMQLMADWYYGGVDMGPDGRRTQSVLAFTDLEKARQWERKAATAGHSTALFNQGLELLAQGDAGRAERIGRRLSAEGVQTRSRPHDGEYLCALALLTRGGVYYDLAHSHLVKAKLNPVASRENLAAILACRDRMKQYLTQKV